MGIEGRIRVGCAGVVHKNGGILLGERNKDPNRGKLILPGGKIEYLESFRQSLSREFLEEADIELSFVRVIGAYEIINPPDEHRVIVYCMANYASGTLRGGSDLANPRFYTKPELKALRAEGRLSDITSTVLTDICWL